MQRDTKIVVVFIVTVALMVGVSHYSFWLGYRTAKEIWRRGGMMQLQPVRPAPPPAQTGT